MFDFYVEQNFHVAVDFYNNMLDESEILINHPYIGKKEPLLEDMPYTFRSLVTNSRLHKIIYFIHKETIYISHIWDCRQDPETIRKR